MKIDGTTMIGDIVSEYPFLLDFLPTISPAYSRLKDRDMLEKMGKVATMEMVANMGGVDLDDLIYSITVEVERVTGERPERNPTGEEEKMGQMKSIIKDLHSGKSVDEVKQRFIDLATEVDPTEIARMEQELIDEGFPEEEIKRLCDVHVEVFRSSLDKKESPDVPPGHPVHTFMKENRVLEGYLGVLAGYLKEIERGKRSLENRREDLKKVLDLISDVNYHYLRKENQLFPLLERYEVSGPSQVMWSLHDDIREMLKEARVKVEMKRPEELTEHLDLMKRTMNDMIYKEEKVLFPMSMEKLSEEDWGKVRRGEEEIGYSWVEPDEGWEAPTREGGYVSEEKLRLDEGYLTLEQINSMLKTLPLDISFVDDRERVRYYSATADRVFPRSPAVIDREVKNCHPPKSVHVVQRILDEFRKGTKDTAEFWIEMHGKFIHIRYFAVKNDRGEFLGTLEVSQDVTGIRELRGEKRLLDWEG